MTKIVLGRKHSGKPLPGKLAAELRGMAEKEVRIANRALADLVLSGWFVPVDPDSFPKFPVELTADADRGEIVNAVLAVAQERRMLLDRLRAALSAHRDAEALEIAREYCNLPKGASRDGKQKVR